MRDRKSGPPKGPDLGNRDQVKRLKRGMERSAELVVRCQKCGHQQPKEGALIGPLTTCDSCDAPLHSCLHCQSYDPRVARQCKKGVRLDVGVAAANECEGFEARPVLDATGKRLRGKTSRDAKSDFDSLFRN